MNGTGPGYTLFQRAAGRCEAAGAAAGCHPGAVRRTGFSPVYGPDALRYPGNRAAAVSGGNESGTTEV